MVEAYLSELGFENIPKENWRETTEAMYLQIEDDPNIADAVLEELREENDPNPVHKDNYDAELQEWIDDQVSLLHQKPRTLQVA